MNSNETSESMKNTGISCDEITGSRESVSGIIGLICYSDQELCKSLLENGVTQENFEKLEPQINSLYERMGKSKPDISWLQTADIKILENNEKNYTIPLPHQK